MANILGTNFSYTYDGDLSTDIIVQDAVANPDIRSVFRVEDNIDHKLQLSLLSPGGKALKGKQGCGTQNTTGSIKNITNRTLEVKPAQMELVQCADVFDATIIGKLRNQGLGRDDLTQSALDVVLQSYATDMLNRELFRAWSFNDTSSGINDYYNWVDGLWPTLISGVSGYSVTGVNTSISALGAPTSSSDDRAVDYFRALHTGAEIVLKQYPASAKRFFVTGNVYENYIWFLESQGTLESSFMKLQDGTETASFRGIPVVPIYAWDNWITTDGLGNNTRILYTLAENHVAGFGQASSYDSLEVWYEKKEKEYRIRAQFQTGYQYVQDKLQAISYGNV